MRQQLLAQWRRRLGLCCLWNDNDSRMKGKDTVCPISYPSRGYKSVVNGHACTCFEVVTKVRTYKSQKIECRQCPATSSVEIAAEESKSLDSTSIIAVMTGLGNVGKGIIGIGGNSISVLSGRWDSIGHYRAECPHFIYGKPLGRAPRV